MKPHFTLFGIPVFVRVSFFILVLVLGAGSYQQPQQIGIFGAIAFLGVMMHELGHAFMGRAFGLQPMIQVVGLGGLTSWNGGRNVGPGRSLLISLAGPAVGITIGGLTAFLTAGRELTNPFIAQIVTDTIWVNLGWGVLNLVPIMPLDGGNAMRSVFGLTNLFDAEIGARAVSLIVGPILGILAAWAGWFFPLILIVMYSVQNVQGIRARLAVRGDEALLKDLQAQYPAWLSNKDGAAMIHVATSARAAAKTPSLYAFATEVVAMGQCLSGDPRSGLATLQTMPQGYAPGLPVSLFILEAAHEYAAAKQVVIDMLIHDESPELRAKLAELERHEHRWALGRLVLSDPHAPELSAEAFEAARAVADTERRHAEAAYVGSLLFERKRDPDLAFQIAREWGKAQEPAKVSEWLGAAAELGFRDVVQIDHCPDFFALHGSSAFQSARQRIAENA